MEQLDGATIFWLISLGMVAGGGLKLILGDERGLGIITNIAGGVIGCLVVGIISIKLKVPGSLLLGLLGTLAILFLANVFFLEDDAHTEEKEQELV